MYYNNAKERRPVLFTETVFTKLSEDQKTGLEQRARAAGKKTSEYVRDLVIRDQEVGPRRDLEDLIGAVGERLEAFRQLYWLVTKAAILQQPIPDFGTLQDQAAQLAYPCWRLFLEQREDRKAFARSTNG